MLPSDNLSHLAYHRRVQPFVGYALSALSFIGHHPFTFQNFFACPWCVSVIDRASTNSQHDISVLSASSRVICSILLDAPMSIPSVGLFAFLVDSHSCVLSFPFVHVFQSNIFHFDVSLFPPFRYRCRCSTFDEPTSIFRLLRVALLFTRLRSPIVHPALVANRSFEFGRISFTQPQTVFHLVSTSVDFHLSISVGDLSSVRNPSDDYPFRQ